MKAEELMWGNIVKRPASLQSEVIIPTYIDTVTGIGSFGSVEFYRTPTLEGFECSAMYLMGVELTPEILEKCGFRKWNKEDEDYMDGRCEITVTPRTEVFAVSAFCEVDGSKWHLRDIQYVHQLQNLYYQLTSFPLQITL